MTEQQNHLQQLLEQQQNLVGDINNLTTQLSAKREILLKIQGVIEYLQQIGTTLPEPEVSPEQESQEEIE